MALLYSKVPPLAEIKNGTPIIDALERGIKLADELRFAVGYVSRGSLQRLNHLVHIFPIRNVTLIAGMYRDGIPASIYNELIDLQEQWTHEGIGQLFLVDNMNFHGKLYTFFKNGIPFQTVIGSANLAVLDPNDSNRRQYEMAVTIDAKEENHEIAKFMQDLQENASSSVDDIQEFTPLPEPNDAMLGIIDVNQLSDDGLHNYQDAKTPTAFHIPINAPTQAEAETGKGHYMKSNINVSYAAPRSKSKARDWYEMQLTVPIKIRKQPGYPEKGIEFFAVTDDGFMFKAHTTSDHNKQFNAVGNELLIGRWIKGRLVSQGLVTPVDDTRLDVNRTGMITQEMLKRAHMQTLVLTKTSRKAFDENNKALDVWMLDFSDEKETGDAE